MINDSCTTLPITIYTINASVIFMNGSQTFYVSTNIMDTSGDSMGRFNVSYNDSFDEELVANATYSFTVNSDNTQRPPSRPADSKYFVYINGTNIVHMYIRTCMYVCTMVLLTRFLHTYLRKLIVKSL